MLVSDGKLRAYTLILVSYFSDLNANLTFVRKFRFFRLITQQFVISSWRSLRLGGEIQSFLDDQ